MKTGGLRTSLSSGWKVSISNGGLCVPIGGDRHYSAGNTNDREKFRRFAEVLCRVVGNPMIHWCHLELRNYFGWSGFLTCDITWAVWALYMETLGRPQQLFRRSPPHGRHRAGGQPVGAGKLCRHASDSRSFLGYTGHEYFHHILCQPMGGLMEE